MECSMTWLYLLVVIAFCLLMWCCGAYIFEIPNLTIFESRSVIFDNHFWVLISYTWIAFRLLERTEVFVMFLMMSCVDLTILESSISIVIYLGYFLVAHWRTIGFCDLSLMPSVVDRELSWSYDYYLMLMCCSWRTDVILWFIFYDVFQLLV